MTASPRAASDERAAQRARVLIVDGDRVSQRAIEICGRVDRPHRPAIAALGGAALRSTIARLVDEGEQPARCVGIAATAVDDLRGLVGRLIRLWATSR